MSSGNGDPLWPWIFWVAIVTVVWGSGFYAVGKAWRWRPEEADRWERRWLLLILGVALVASIVMGGMLLIGLARSG